MRLWRAAQAHTRPLVGHGLPAPLHQRLHDGGWLRTAHRGAPLVAPGNTALAITTAAALDIDLIEIDVHSTADGHLVLWHDDDLPAPGGKLPIARNSLTALRRVDLGGGQRILELADAVDLVRGRTALMLDLKTGGLAQALVDTLRHLNPGPVVVCGHYWGTMRQIKALAPQIGVAYTLHRTWRRTLGSIAIERGHADAVTVNHRIIDRSLVDRYHASGVAVLAWTVDDPERMRRLLALGVNGLTSNRPDLFAGITVPGQLAALAHH